MQTNKPARQEKETERGRRIPENEWELVSFYALFGTPRGERPGLWAILADASSSGDLMGGGRSLNRSLLLLLPLCPDLAADPPWCWGEGSLVRGGRGDLHRAKKET